MKQVEYERVTNLNHLRAPAEALEKVTPLKDHGVSEAGLRRAKFDVQQLIDKLVPIVEKDIQR